MCDCARKAKRTLSHKLGFFAQGQQQSLENICGVGSRAALFSLVFSDLRRCRTGAVVPDLTGHRRVKKKESEIET